MSGIDFASINAQLLARSRSFLSELFPAGKIRGHEFIVGNIQGEAGKSLSINLNTGIGADFATGESFGDLIAVYAAHHRLDMGAAAKKLSNGAGHALPAARTTRPSTDAIPECRHRQHGQPSAIYAYRDEGGLIFCVARYDLPDGKQIVPWCYESGAWHARGYSRPRPLYGLEQLQAKPGRAALVVEGEKCVDHLRKFNVARVPVTWSGGASAWKHTDWSPLAGRDVLLFPDHDGPGFQCMDALAQYLLAEGRVKNVSIIDHVREDLPLGWDIADTQWTSREMNDWAKPLVQPVEREISPPTPPMPSTASDEPPSIPDDYVPFSSVIAASDDDAWEPPIDLWTQRPAQPMSLSALPPMLRDYVADQADLIGCDTTVIGISALVIAASVIDDGFRIQPKEHDTTWTESARLWGAIVGEPSSKKSPGIGAAIKPLRKIEAKLAEANQFEMKLYDEELARYTAARGKDKGSPPTRPISRRTMTQNATVEALSDILKDNPQGILCATDELSGWFGAMDVYSKGGGKDRGLWLEAYNGGAQLIDRVTRGNIFVPNWSVCVLGGIQPDIFSSLTKRVDNDGLMQRFMVVLAGKAAQDTDRAPNSDAIRDYYRIIQSLRDLRPRTDEAVYTLSRDAQVVRRLFMDTVDKLADTHLPRGMAGYLGKWSGLFARLLCTYHAIEANGETPAPLIGADTTMRVCQLMETCLYPHAHQFYDEYLGSGEANEHASWIAGHILATGATEITTREISMHYKAFRKVPDHLRNSVWGKLEESAWIRPGPTARINKRFNIPTRWDVNPLAHSLFESRTQTEKRQRANARQQIQSSVEAWREKNKPVA